MNKNRMNFTKEQTQVYNTTLDLARNDFAFNIDSDKITKTDLENHLRNTINNDILKGATLYQAYRRNNVVLFEIMEEIVNVTVQEDVIDSPFMSRFVEIRNKRLGDSDKFYAEGGLLSVASFSGNHWDTNRQSMDIGEAFTLPTEWAYIHIYEELERFLLEITPLEKMIDKIYRSINKFFQDRLYAQFNNVIDTVPEEFSKIGNDEESLGALVDLVQAAGGYSSITIAGTRAALRKLTKIIPEHMFANSQKEAKAQTGSIGDWEGNDLLVIPQTLKSETFELALSNDTVFILGGDVKPIKLTIEGDTRTDMDTTGKKNNDQTVDIQVQTKFGMGLIMPQYFGQFTFK